jgi:glycosyltransferase involved in cell wall biosynthesis
MRILIISQYFWPENFRINDLCLNLKERGHSVTVLTGKPNYPKGRFYDGYNYFNKNIEVWEEINIIRSFIIPRKNASSFNLIINYLSFLFSSCIKIFTINKKFDKIIAYQLSPGLIGAPAIIAKIKFNAPLFFYIQDLWPESIEDAGGVKSSLLIKSIDNLMKFFYNNSNTILVQSKGFIKFLEKKGVENNKIKYLPNTVENFYKPVNIDNEYLKKLPNGFNIIFAGNLGEAQALNLVIESAKIIKDKLIPINWIFFGDGRVKSNLIKLTNDLNLSSNVYFFDSVPSNEMPNYFACADVLLASLKKSVIFSLTIPSKIQSYLACAKPILAIIDGEGAKVIQESKSGYISQPGDIETFVENTVKIFNLSQDERKELGKNGFKYFKDEFSRTHIYNKLESLINNHD